MTLPLQKTIGLLGGMSDQATTAYYRLINQKTNARLGGWHNAEILIASVNFGVIEHHVRRAEWDAIARYLAPRAHGLQAAGADFLICASNTAHRVADEFTRSLAIPFLHIADPTGRAIRRAKLRRVALLGTRTTMSAAFLRNRFSQKYSLEILVPSPTDQAEVDRIIFDELTRDVITPTSQAFVRDLCLRLQHDGAEGVIFGCTELPLLLSADELPDLPVFDTTDLHAAAAVEFALDLG